MRTLAAAIGILILALWMSAAAETGPAPARLPDLSDVSEIRLRTPSSWFLHIRRDGSARIFGSAAAGDEASAPTNTFQFQEVFAWLSNTVLQSGQVPRPEQPAGINGQWVTVTFATPKKEVVYPYTYVCDTKRIRELFDTARQGSVRNDLRRFENLWKKRPTFSGTLN
jgi:hypothetical protein